MNGASHSDNRFATTRWSLVMQMPGTAHADAGDALSELAQRYWYPVYAYVRRRGHSPAGAREMASRFMAQLKAMVNEGRSLTPQGHFRSFLLGRLDAFLSGNWDRDDWPDEPTALSRLPDNLEQRFERDRIIISRAAPQNFAGRINKEELHFINARNIENLVKFVHIREHHNRARAVFITAG